MEDNNYNGDQNGMEMFNFMVAELKRGYDEVVCKQGKSEGASSASLPQTDIQIIYEYCKLTDAELSAKERQFLNDKLALAGKPIKPLTAKQQINYVSFNKKNVLFQKLEPRVIEIVGEMLKVDIIKWKKSNSPDLAALKVVSKDANKKKERVSTKRDVTNREEVPADDTKKRAKIYGQTPTGLSKSG